MTTHKDGMEYDIIFAGGGTAACVAAGRLAQADPSLSILLVESGKSNLNNPMITNPAIFLTQVGPDSQNALFYKSNKSEHLGGRECVVVTGGVLGGGSSVNFMMYTRAQARDYDSWETEGWDFESLLPYLKKVETFHDDGTSVDWNVHGSNGAVQVSSGTYRAKEAEADILAAAEASGEKILHDLNDFRSCGGFARWYRYVGPDGKRSDAAHSYIHPLIASSKYPNLHLLLETKVVRVLLDDSNTANGVEVLPTASYQPTLALSKPKHTSITARKLVVVSSGALGSPSILERSGIGAASCLSSLGIESVSDLPGIGENYQDHPIMIYPYKSSLQPSETIDGLVSGRLDFEQAVTEKNPILGWNGMDVAAKVRPTSEEAEAFGPEFHALWKRDFEKDTERPLGIIVCVNGHVGDPGSLPTCEEGKSVQYVTASTCPTYPYSRGSIHITSKDVADPPSLDCGFLSHPADLKKLLWMYKKQRDVYRRSNLYRGELKLGHPKFPEGSKAALLDGPVVPGRFEDIEARKAVADIQYTLEDDAAIEDWIRLNVNTMWHSMGTCKMAAREKGGAVDKDLNVYGVKKLKVADMSICPEIVGANTNNTALMIGEKAAAIIAQELGLNL